MPAVGPVALVDGLVGVPELVAGEVVRRVALVTGYVGSGGVQKDEEDGEEDGGQRGKCGKVLPHFGYCNARVYPYWDCQLSHWTIGRGNFLVGVVFAVGTGDLPPPLRCNTCFTASKFPEYARKMTSCVLPCFSGGIKPGLHAGGQIKSKANGTHFTI